MAMFWQRSTPWESVHKPYAEMRARGPEPGSERDRTSRVAQTARAQAGGPPDDDFVRESIQRSYR